MNTIHQALKVGERPINVGERQGLISAQGNITNTTYGTSVAATNIATELGRAAETCCGCIPIPKFLLPKKNEANVPTNLSAQAEHTNKPAQQESSLSANRPVHRSVSLPVLIPTQMQMQREPSMDSHINRSPTDVLPLGSPLNNQPLNPEEYIALYDRADRLMTERMDKNNPQDGS
ncbi:MAG: hypothetical protein ACJAUP_003046 [Cellvibrionaceae bacterium]|jgi:hypothetical protein